MLNSIIRSETGEEANGSTLVQSCNLAGTLIFIAFGVVLGEAHMMKSLKSF